MVETVKANITCKKHSNQYCLNDVEIINHLLKSEEDIKNGRTRKATEVLKELETKYGF